MSTHALHEFIWGHDWAWVTIIVVGVVCGVITTIINYFWIHSDVGMTRGQMWDHVLGLLAFFLLGCGSGGFLTYVMLHLLGKI